MRDRSGKRSNVVSIGVAIHFVLTNITCVYEDVLDNRIGGRKSIAGHGYEEGVTLPALTEVKVELDRWVEKFRSVKPLKSCVQQGCDPLIDRSEGVYNEVAMLQFMPQDELRETDRRYPKEEH